MKAKRITIIAFSLVVLFMLFGVLWNFFLSPDIGAVIGKLDINSIKQIELVGRDEKIIISNPDEIKLILSCFNTDVSVITRSYDSSATGGCAGYHWDKEFSMKLISDEHGTVLNFSDCDAPHQHEISKNFIIWSVNPIIQFLYINTNCRFLLSGYDLQNLSDNVNKYINVKCVL